MGLMDWLLDIGMWGIVLVLAGMMIFGISSWWLLVPAVPIIVANVMWWLPSMIRRRS